jgi:hypothetical protein
MGAGEYEVLLISDDGASFYVQEDGSEHRLIDNDGIHSTKLACAPRTVRLDPARPLPIRLTYFQGPREYLTVTLMIREARDSLYRDQAGNHYGRVENSVFYHAQTLQ